MAVMRAIGPAFSMLLVMICIGGWVALLVAIWRGMKAHEYLADSFKFVARRIQQENEAQRRPSAPPDA